MSDSTLTADTQSMLAVLAASLNGGRFAARADESVRADALALVMPLRAARRKASALKRYATKREALAADKAQRAEWFASWSGYDSATDCRSLTHSGECCAIGRVMALYGVAPRRMTVRKIAKRILSHATITCTDSAQCACVDCFTLGDWRATIRQYRDAKRAIDSIGRFGISRFDATPTVESRFYRSVVRHWHGYTGGKHAQIHGVTPDDVFQDAMVSAITSGDAIDGVPVFGSMYVHARRAVESAVYVYRRGHSHGEAFTAWTWADWQEWASAPERQSVALRVRHSTDAEWSAFLAAQDAANALAAYDEALAAQRAADMAMLDESRKALAALITGGMTVRQIARMLNRTPDGIATGLAALDIAERYLPTRPVETPLEEREDIETSRRFALGDVARAALAAPRAAITVALPSASTRPIDWAESDVPTFGYRPADEALAAEYDEARAAEREARFAAQDAATDAFLAECEARALAALAA